MQSGNAARQTYGRAPGQPPGKAQAEVHVQRAKAIAAVSPGVRPERDDSLTRLRRGVYASTGAWDAEDRDAAYLMRIRAVLAVRPRAIFARESALAVHGIPYGLEPGAVFTTGDTRTAGKKAGIVHAQFDLDPADVTVVGDLAVCSLAFALADVARRCSVLDAVSAIDAALRLGSVTKEQMRDALGRQSKGGRARAEWAIEFADAAAESVGESWSRVRVHQLGFAAPELQVWVAGPTGKEWRVDMRFRRDGRRPVYGEFDGMQKYGSLAHQQGKSGAEALAKEKARDDELLFSGDPAHWIWMDVHQPSRLDRILTGYGVPRVRPPMLNLSRCA